MIVLDASAAVAIALGTEDGLAMRALMLDGEPSRAPSLLVPEVTNALWKYVQAEKLEAGQATELARLANELVDEFADMQELQVEVLREAVRLQHPAYDMFYFVLARRLGATLFTLDRKLMRLCEENGVGCVHLIRW